MQYGPTDRPTDMTKLVVLSPIDMWTRLKIYQRIQGAVRVSNQIPPNYKLTPNSSYLLGTELHVIPTGAFIGNSETSWTAHRRMSPVILKMVNLQRRTHIALGEVMSDPTASTTVICLGDMCWLIRQFDIKPWRILRNQSVQEGYNCRMTTSALPGQSFDQTYLLIDDRMGQRLRAVEENIDGTTRREVRAVWQNYIRSDCNRRRRRLLTVDSRVRSHSIESKAFVRQSF